jgi:hypothetical protein
VLDDGLRLITGGAVDPSAPAVSQMVEGSAFLDELAARPLPPDVRFTSVAAAGDPVVPATSSTVARATNVIGPLDAPDAHGRLPGSPLATHVVGRALAGQGPPCTSPVALAGLVGMATVVAGTQHAAAGARRRRCPILDDLAGAVTSGCWGRR